VLLMNAIRIHISDKIVLHSCDSLNMSLKFDDG